MLAKLLPTEMVVSCCSYHNEENIYLVSRQGKIFCINSNEIYYANEYCLGYLNEKIQIKDDYFIKILPSNNYLDIETNKNKSARLNFGKLNFKSIKTNLLIDFLQLETGEHLENCFRLKNLLD
jgi:DNA gyrase subunit A